MGGGGGDSIKGQPYFAEIHLSRGVLVLINRENRGVTVYPSLMHVNCVAHLLHNCAMRVHAHFKNIDEVIATIKAATIENKDRKKDFHDAGLPSPPDPVITRWATWLRAALYYSENLPAVRTIVNNWTSAGLLVSRAKDAIYVEDLVPNLV